VQLVLASASPRRADLLRAAGIDFDVRPAGVDESIRAGEAPEHYACRVAFAKARAVSERIPGHLVLGADTIVVVDGQILGKPSNANDAGRMLRILSGRSHQVMTAVALLGATSSGSVDETCIETTTVEFAPLSDGQIAWYVASGEPLDKAGAYAVQGLASRFVTRVEGSYSNVVGLPVSLVYVMCKRAGLLLS
jgi:septum formation protein